MNIDDKRYNEVIKVEHLNKSFNVSGKKVDILKDINLSINAGEFITIVGHSGCGKSTLLKIICGLVDHSEGTVIRSGEVVNGPGPNCGMVFQDHRLLPWLKVKDNVGFGLNDLSKAEREKRVKKYLDLVGLSKFINSYPSQLSGGMSQRAAIARGLVNNPDILLLDEPFGALDALTRIQMQKEILRIQEEQKTTMIMVTHDIEEAIYLGNRIIVMSSSPGKIEEIIEIKKGSNRKRNSVEFTAYKKRIYDHFFKDTENEDEVKYMV